MKDTLKREVYKKYFFFNKSLYFIRLSLKKETAAFDSKTQTNFYL